MSRGNPNIALARKGRASVSSRLFISLNAEYGVTVDGYNVTLAKIYHDTKQNKVTPLGQRYHSTFQGLVQSLKELEFSEEIIRAYEDKVKDIKTKVEAGKLKVTLPKDFVSDPNPFVEEGATEEEDVVED